MVLRRIDIRLKPKFTDHLMVLDLSILFLLLQTIAIEICSCDKVANFGTTTLSFIYYHLTAFSKFNSIINKK